MGAAPQRACRRRSGVGAFQEWRLRRFANIRRSGTTPRHARSADGVARRRDRQVRGFPTTHGRSVMKRLFATLAVLAASLAPGVASAHPLGNFTVNHYARLEPDGNQIRVFYVLD